MTPLVCAAVALALVAACGGPRTERRTSDASTWVDTTPTAVGKLGTVHWNLILEPATIDPQQANNYGENDVLANLCESLQTLNPDFSVSDGLASMKAEDGGRRLVYTIDPEARFWDGSPVTEEDVAFSLTRVWHPEGVGTPYYTPYFSAVKSIEATGDDEVTVTLNHPDVLFQKMMATAAGVVMQADYTRDHPDVGKPTVPPMCTGPYTFGSWTTGSQLTIKRNDNYWRGTPAMTREIVFTFLQGDASQTQALTGGAIQGMYQPPFTALGQLRKHGSLFYGKSLLSFYLIPTSKPGPLRDPRIRRALYLALNRDAVARAAFSGAAVASRTMLPMDSYASVEPTTAKGTGGSEEEIARARELVDQAGAPDEEIVIVGCPAISDSMTQSLRAIVEAADSIGLNAKLKLVTFGEYAELFSGPQGWEQTDADAFGSQWTLPVADPQALFSVWGNPDDPQNYSQFSDDEASTLLEQAAREGNEAARDELLGEADARLFHLLPWIPVVDVANVLYLDDSMTGPPASFVNWYYPWAAQLGRSAE